MARTSAFFPETDDPKLGIQPKSLAAGLLFEDALLEWRLTTVFQIVGGDRIVPFSRNGLESTLSYLTLDVSRISTVSNADAQKYRTARCFEAKGFFNHDHLLYRLGEFGAQ